MSIERVNWKRTGWVTLGVAAVAGATFGGMKIADVIHDSDHPTLGIGVEHPDVNELNALVRGSRESLFSGATASSVMSESLLREVTRIQLGKGDDPQGVGNIQEGDGTWKWLQGNQAGEAPSDLAEACYDGAVICIEKDTPNGRATVYVMGDGKLKAVIDGVGIGKPDEQTDNGIFTVDKDRMEEIHFSSGAGYDGAKMLYFIPYNGAEGLHYSQVLDGQGIDEYTGSGGCPTISDANTAEWLFRVTEAAVDSGMIVNVVVSEE